VEAISGEGVIVDPPVGSAAFEAQAPPIEVEQPLPGDVTKMPQLVRGSANGLEAQLAVDVQPHGESCSPESTSSSRRLRTRAL
jgi:hypothetical protein